MLYLFFFFNDTATTEIYTLSLHDALPICNKKQLKGKKCVLLMTYGGALPNEGPRIVEERSEEHTSELQSRQYLVCRLLLEKKKKATPSARVDDYARRAARPRPLRTSLSPP